MPNAAEGCRKPSGNCEVILHCLESVTLCCFCLLHDAEHDLLEIAKFLVVTPTVFKFLQAAVKLVI